MTEWWRIDGWPTSGEWQAFWSFAAAVLAGALLLVAWRQLAGLALSNKRLAESNTLLADSNRVLSRPTMVVQFEFERVASRNYTNTTNANNVFVVVENVGASPAIDVTLQVAPAFEATDKKLTAEGLDALNALFDGSQPIRMIAPRQRLKYILDSAKDALKSADLPREYRVTVTYADIEGTTKYREIFILQMSPWGMSVAEVDPAKQISKDIQFVSENLRGSQGGLPRIASELRNLQADQAPRRLPSLRAHARKLRR